MGEFRILTPNGDERLEWDPADTKSVKAAKDRFDALKKDGYEFYEVTETKGKRVERFSKGLGKLIAAPAGRTEADKARGTRQRGMGGGPRSSSVALPEW